MIIVYGINSLYYDFVGASPISSFDSGFSHLCTGLCGDGQFPALIHHLLRSDCGSVCLWVLWNTRPVLVKHFCYWRQPEAAKVSGVNVALTC